MYKTLSSLLYVALVIGAMIFSFWYIGKSKFSDAEIVTEVIDGDTITINAEWSPYPLEWKVRIKGIDAPEMEQRAKCPQEIMRANIAKARLESLLRNSDYRIMLSDVDHDKYGGRLLADVYLIDGRSVSDILLQEKLVVEYHGRGAKENWCAA